MREPSPLRRSNSRRAIALACAAAVCLAACGQKGPLRLPEKSGAVVVKPAPESPPQQSGSGPRATGQEPDGKR